MWSPVDSYMNNLVNVAAPTTFMHSRLPITGMMSSREQFTPTVDGIFSKHSEVIDKMSKLKTLHAEVDNDPHDKLTHDGYLRSKNSIYDASQEDATMLINQQTTMLTIGMIAVAALVVVAGSLQL